MRSGFNFTRRNRNIGTDRQGLGQNNRFTVPRARGLHAAVDRIGQHAREERQIHGRRVIFFIEATRQGCVHACSVEDVAQLLEAVPASDWVGIGTIVLRQPTRKQETLAPAWGRLRYEGEVSTHDGGVVATGPMIHLDAIREHLCINWSSSLGPDDRAELDRLIADGHHVSHAGRRHTIAVTPASARHTQLYRTLPHEIGHWFDWLSKVEEPALRGEDRQILADRYFARPAAERETFAHRYADALYGQLIEIKRIPFDPR